MLLFALKYDFMNKKLRNFLNLNDNGSEDYSWEEITKNFDWQEFPSLGAMYHQTTSGDDYVVYKKDNGEVTTVYTRLNAKFANKKGGIEVVFRYKDKNNIEQVKDDIDRGTYNYSGRGMINTGIESLPGGEHQRYDVAPYNDEYLSRVIIRWNYCLGPTIGNSKYWNWK
jgi:hypothetical protein